MNKRGLERIEIIGRVWITSGYLRIGEALPEDIDRTPPAGYIHLYVKESTLYFKDDTGAETQIGTPGSGIMDGDYGDITVSSSGTVWTIDADAVTLGKIANAAANSKLLGSGATGSGANYVELTLGTNLSISGTTLNATGGGTIDVAEVDGSPAATVDTLKFNQANGLTVTDNGDGSATVGHSGGGGSGGLILVEKKLIAANATSVTFSSLDGDTHGVYFLTFKILNASGATAVYTLKPNNVTTNQTYTRIFANAAGGPTRASGSVLFIADATTGLLVAGSLHFHAAKEVHSVTQLRFMYGISVNNFSSGTTHQNIAGTWAESSTNLTSLVVFADQTNGIGDGSELTLYRLAQS